MNIGRERMEMKYVLENFLTKDEDGGVRFIVNQRLVGGIYVGRLSCHCLNLTKKPERTLG